MRTISAGVTTPQRRHAPPADESDEKDPEVADLRLKRDPKRIPADPRRSHNPSRPRAIHHPDTATPPPPGKPTGQALNMVQWVYTHAGVVFTVPRYSIAIT